MCKKGTSHNGLAPAGLEGMAGSGDMVEPLGSKAALTPEARRAKPQGRQVGKWDSTRASLDLKKWGHQGQRPKNRMTQARAEAWEEL